MIRKFLILCVHLYVVARCYLAGVVRAARAEGVSVRRPRFARHLIAQSYMDVLDRKRS